MYLEKGISEEDLKDYALWNSHRDRRACRAVRSLRQKRQHKETSQGCPFPFTEWVLNQKDEKNIRESEEDGDRDGGRDAIISREKWDLISIVKYEKKILALQFPLSSLEIQVHEARVKFHNFWAKEDQ